MASERHKKAIPSRPNSKANKDGGLTRSSDEVSVMEMERRGRPIYQRRWSTLTRMNLTAKIGWTSRMK